MAAETNSVIITAGGEGSRIRGFMTEELGLPPDYPKHLLPTGDPSGETLIGRIIRQAEQVPSPELPVVNAREVGVRYMQAHPDISAVEFDLEHFRFSMDPIYYRLRRTGKRVLGCAGDFYSEFSWADLITQHEASGAAMSLLVNKTSGPVEAAVFDVDPLTNRITGLRRPAQSMAGDYTNVGAYIMDPTDEVFKILDAHLPDDPADAYIDDTIFSYLLRAGLAGAVHLEGKHANINTPNEYLDLQAYTGAVSVSSTIEP